MLDRTLLSLIIRRYAAAYATAQLVWLGRHDSIIDPCGSGWPEKRERGSNRLRSGIETQLVGDEHTEAIGHRMTHSQRSNSGSSAEVPVKFAGSRRTHIACQPQCLILPL
jgi:hypothetical protein